MIGRIRMKTKFLLGAVLLVLMLGGAVLLAVQWVVAESLSEELELHGVVVAQSTARECSDLVLTENWVELQMQVNRHAAADGVQYVIVVGPGGKPLAHSLKGGLPGALLAANSVETGHKFSSQRIDADGAEIIDIAVPILDGKPGQVRMGMSAEAVSASVVRVTNRLGLIVGAVLLLGAIGSLFLAGAITRPLNELQRVTAAVGSGDFESKAQLAKGDEIGDLGAAFDTMVDELRYRNEIQEGLNSVLSVGLEDLKLEEMLGQALDAALAPVRLSLDAKGAVFIADHEAHNLSLKAHRGLPQRVKEACAVVPFGRCPCGVAGETGKLHYSSHATEGELECLVDSTEHGHYCVPMVHALKVLGVADFHLKAGYSRNDRDEQYLAAVAKALAGMVTRWEAQDKLEGTMGRLRKTLGGIIDAIGIAGERRDPYAAGHQKRVADLARALAAKVGLSAEETEGVRVAGVIHDIGKLSVPAELLNKAGRLSEIEMGLIKTHSTVGFEILEPIDFPWPVAEIVHQHHERLDGSGYPKGLKGDEITRGARVLAVADVVEAMSSHRPYRPALGVAAALEEITTHRGTRYDGKVVDACVSVFKEDRFEFRSPT